MSIRTLCHIENNPYLRRGFMVDAFSIKGPSGNISAEMLLPRAFDKEHGRCELVILMHGFLGSMKAAPLGFLSRMLVKHGYELYATGGTSKYLTDNGIQNTLVHWPSDAGQPQALDLLHQHKIDMVVNIPKDLTTHELTNGYKIRRAAIDLNVPLITNARLASAFIQAFCTVPLDAIGIKSWNEYK